MAITLKKGKVTRVIDLIAVFDVALQLLLNKDKYPNFTDKKCTESAANKSKYNLSLKASKAI